MRTQSLIGLKIDSGPYGTGIAQGVGQYAVRHNKPWVIRRTGEYELEHGWQPSGLIVSAGTTASIQTYLTNRCVPVVNISARLLPLPPHTVCIDNETVGRLAARHLLDRGLRSFATFDVQTDLGYALLRMRGFTDEVNTAGFRCEVGHWEPERVVIGIEQGQPAGDALAQWLRSQPSPLGVYCVDDKSAFALLEIAETYDLQVPNRLSVIGSDNDSGIHGGRSLSSVELGSQAVGFEAAAMLDLLIRGRPVLCDPALIQPVGVVPRASTDVTHVLDRHVATVLHFIEKNLTERITVQAVVRRCGVSRRWMERRIRKITGRSILDHIQRSKIERAKQLLTTTPLRSADIATQLGFRDASRFSRVFRTVVGIPPGRYRNRLAQHPGDPEESRQRSRSSVRLIRTMPDSAKGHKE